MYVCKVGGYVHMSAGILLGSCNCPALGLKLSEFCHRATFPTHFSWPLLQRQHLFLRLYMNRTVCMCVCMCLCTHECVCMCVHMSAHMGVFACTYTYSPQLLFYNSTLISLGTSIISMLLSEGGFFPFNPFS